MTLAQFASGNFPKKRQRKSVILPTGELAEESGPAPSSTSTSSVATVAPSRGPLVQAASGGPQVELIKGNIVLKESSLTVIPESSIDDYEEVVEGLHPTAKYSSFLDKPR